MYLDCGNDDPRCEELVDMFLNRNYCESVKLPTMLDSGSEYDNPGDDHSASISYSSFETLQYTLSII